MPLTANMDISRIPGIGNVVAFTIVLEVSDIKRFASAKDFVSYCRLVPPMPATQEARRGTSARKTATGISRSPSVTRRCAPFNIAQKSVRSINEAARVIRQERHPAPTTLPKARSPLRALPSPFARPRRQLACHVLPRERGPSPRDDLRHRDNHRRRRGPGNGASPINVGPRGVVRRVLTRHMTPHCRDESLGDRCRRGTRCRREKNPLLPLRQLHRVAVRWSEVEQTRQRPCRRGRDVENVTKPRAVAHRWPGGAAV